MAYSLVTTRKTVHMSMLVFAFLLPFLTWPQAVGCAVLALLFNIFLLPRLEVDFGKRPGREREADSPWTGIILYPVSVLLLILFYRRSMQIVAAVWAIMALGDGLASVVGEAMGGPVLPYNPRKTWWGFSAFVVAGTMGAYALTRWVARSLPASQGLAVCAATAVVGALVESVPIRLDDNLTVPLVSGGFMFCAYLVDRQWLAGNLPALGIRAPRGVAVSVAFALLAWGLKTVNSSGVIAGFLLGMAIYLGAGFRGFLVLLGFFLLGSVATRLGYATKAARGVAEHRSGRSWREALANALAGAFFAILVVTTPYPAAFTLAFVAAFAEAAGDTVSSEIGQWLSARAYLITSFRPVAAGENGGITLAGTAAGTIASAAVVTLAWGLGLTGKGGAAVALAAAMLGTFLDSLLGATLERRGLVTNGIVNFAGTSVAGVLTLLWVWQLH